VLDVVSTAFGVVGAQFLEIPVPRSIGDGPDESDLFIFRRRSVRMDPAPGGEGKGGEVGEGIHTTTTGGV